MSKPNVNVALIGQKFMGRAHSNAYVSAPRFFELPVNPVMHTIVARDLPSLQAFADKWGWARATTDWRAAVTSPEIDLVDVTTPNNLSPRVAVYTGTFDPVHLGHLDIIQRGSRLFDRLIVGGDLYDSNWAVNGNIVLGGTRYGPERWLTNGNIFRTVNPITFDADGNVPANGSGTGFDALHSSLLAVSAAIGALEDRGVVQKDASLPYRADFVGNDPVLNVFNVTASE